MAPTQQTAQGSEPTWTGGSTAGDLGPATGDPIQAVLIHAPLLLPPTGRPEAAEVVVELELEDPVKPMSEGIDHTFWTFRSEVPGSFIGVRQGDTAELRLQDHPSSKIPHNVNLHAVSGPGGP